MEKRHLMETTKTLSPELLGADAALRRAALKAKEEAERLGTPYVVRFADEVKTKTTYAKTK